MNKPRTIDGLAVQWRIEATRYQLGLIPGDEFDERVLIMIKGYRRNGGMEPPPHPWGFYDGPVIPVPIIAQSPEAPPYDDYYPIQFMVIHPR